MVTVPGSEVQRTLRYSFIITLNRHRSKELSKLCFELEKHHSLKLFSTCVCVCVCACARVYLAEGKESCPTSMRDISSVIMQFAVLDFQNRGVSFWGRETVM